MVLSFLFIRTPYLFVPLVSYHWVAIIGSILVYSYFICFPIIGTPFKILSMFVLSFIDLSSLGHHPRFYLSLIICSFGFLSSLGFYLRLFFFDLVSHHWDTILGFILVYFLFIWFLITRTSSWVLSKLNRLVLWFLIIGTPS